MMINVYCVWVKPKYTIEHVLRLKNSIIFSQNWKFICLTDQPDICKQRSIDCIDVKSWQLQGWWNKMIIFNYTSPINVYFDLDISIHGNLDCLLDYQQINTLTIVDTPWKAQKYFDQKLKNPGVYKRPEAYLHYGNSSVMLWDNQQQLWNKFVKNIDRYCAEFFGDDGFIAKYGQPRYFTGLNIRPFYLEDNLITYNVK